MGILNMQGQRGSMSVPALFGFLSLFAALCTIFALGVTVAEGWREHAQSGWPVASASIQRCALDTYVRVRGGIRSTRSRITCDIQYTVNGEDVQARLHSASSSSDKDVSRMQHWVSEHRTGKSIEIHYDPSNSKNAVLTETDMPFAGPHTPNNLKLLTFAAVAFVVFYSVARILQSRQGATPPVPA
jgi:hypothetical protein